MYVNRANELINCIWLCVSISDFSPNFNIKFIIFLLIQPIRSKCNNVGLMTTGCDGAPSTKNLPKKLLGDKRGNTRKHIYETVLNCQNELLFCKKRKFLLKLLTIRMIKEKLCISRTSRHRPVQTVTKAT